MQLDLGLDTRLKEMPDPQPCVARLRGVQGRVVDVAPDRPRHLRASPDALIGESNLATDRPLTATKTAGIDLQRDRVRAVIVEGRILAAERADQSPRNKGIKNAIRRARIARSRSHYGNASSTRHRSLSISQRPNGPNRTAPEIAMRSFWFRGATLV